jgi:hypothetical protein
LGSSGGSSGHLDQSTLTSFVGASNGFVVTWYDQSGNGNNITQSTNSNQAQIVSSGTVTVENGLPALAGLSAVIYNTGITGLVTKSIFAVSNLTQNSGANTVRILTSYAGTGAVGDEMGFDRIVSSNTMRIFDGGTNITVAGATAAQHQVSAIRTATDISVDVDSGTAASTPSNSNANTNTYKLFEESLSVGTTIEQPENIQELIFYDSNQTANRAAINLDQKTYFGTP